MGQGKDTNIGLFIINGLSQDVLEHKSQSSRLSECAHLYHSEIYFSFLFCVGQMISVGPSF